MAVALPFIGAAAGWAVGGTFLGVSAVSWGWMAGSLLASAMFKPPGQQGPRLDDLRIVGTDYGQTIPWVFGTPRLSGQYIWASDIREIANTQKVGKGGGQKVTTYTYEVDVLILITENPIAGISRVWLNGEMVHNNTGSKAGLWNAITFYTGDQGQLPDPTYEGAEGAGNAPAYRGHAYVAIQGLQLGNGKQLPNLEFEANGIGPDPLVVLQSNIAYGSTEDLSQYQLGPGIVREDPRTGVTVEFDNGAIVVDNSSGSDQVYTQPLLQYFGPQIHWDPPTGSDNSVFTVEGLFTFNRSLTLTNDDSVSTPILEYSSDPSKSVGSKTELRLSGANIRDGTSITNLTTQIIVDVNGGIPVVLFQEMQPSADFDPVEFHFAAVFYEDGTVNLYFNGELQGTVPGAGLSTAREFASPRLSLLGHLDGSTHQLGKNTAVSVRGFKLTRSALYSGSAFTPPSVLPIGLYDPNAVGERPGGELRLAVNQLLTRAGYYSSQYDTADLDDTTVYSIALGQVSSTRGALETLRVLGKFEASCTDKLYIRPRAVSPVGTVDWKDLGAMEGPSDGDEPFPLRLGNETEIPAQIAVRYRNTAADDNIGTEFSDRLVSSQVSTQVVELGIGMLPAQAKAVADTMLKDLMAGLGRVQLKVPGRKYAKYVPGDVLTTTDPDGRTYRFRIIRINDLIFMQEWDCALDDASALESPAITYEGYIPTDNFNQVVATDWEVLSIPPLRDADAENPGPYVAIRPLKTTESDEWPGAAFVRARLPEAFEHQFTTGDVCVMGLSQTALPSFEKGSTAIQNTGKVRVRVLGELSTASRADFFADRTINAAAIGDGETWEPIRFLRADFVSNDGVFRIYDVSHFLRGQLGQEQEIKEHPIGSSFVLLNSSLRRMVNETTDIGQEQQVKAVTLNFLLDSVVDQDFTDDGIALRPYSAWNLRALPDGSDVVITWKRRSRLVARYTDAGTFTPSSEPVDAYRVKVYDGSTVVRSTDVSVEMWTYTAADMASDGFSSTDQFEITVEQLSATVGEGFAATVGAEAP